METILSAQQIATLSHLKGDQFELIGGESLPEFLMGSSISIFSNNQSVKLYGRVVDGDFEGFENEYSVFGITENNSKVTKNIVSSGNTYNKCQGQSIEDIHIVRETITEFINESPTWSLISDVAIVFELNKSAIAISFLSHNTEALRVTYLDSLTLDSIPKTGNDFESDLYRTYESSRQIFSTSQMGE